MAKEEWTTRGLRQTLSSSTPPFRTISFGYIFEICEIFSFHSYLSCFATYLICSPCVSTPNFSFSLSFAHFVFHRLAPSPLPCLISARPICTLTMDHSPFLLKVTTLLLTLPDAQRAYQAGFYLLSDSKTERKVDPHSHTHILLKG